VYAAEVNGQRLIFEVAGVYRRNMIIRDRQTGTLWQHATGEALLGSLKGVRLQPLGCELIRWSKWKELYPNTTLGLEPIPEHGRFPGLIPRDRLEYLLETFSTNYAASGFVTDNRLPMHEEIVGVSLAGVDKAYPLFVIRDKGIVHDQIEDKRIAIVNYTDANHVNVFNFLVNNKSIELTLANDTLSSNDGMMRWTWMGSPLTADTPPLQKLHIERQWWLGWIEFHPASEVYQSKSE